MRLPLVRSVVGDGDSLVGESSLIYVIGSRTSRMAGTCLDFYFAEREGCHMAAARVVMAARKEYGRRFSELPAMRVVCARALG